MKLLQKVQRTIRKYEMLHPEDRVLVAVSGGPDSVALLRVLQRLSKGLRLEISAAYFNHRLRGSESREEECFVEDLCRKLGLPLQRGCMDARRRRRSAGGLEALCREERYRFLDATRVNLGFHKIALGHQRGDQAETVLMHLIRGSGLTGLTGMLPVRGGVYIRPLLETTREEILLFLREEGLGYVLDRTNESDAFLRNRIRHHLLGEILVAYNPRVEENIAQLAHIIADEDDYMNSVVDGLIRSWGLHDNGSPIHVKIDCLLELHTALQRRLIRRLLQPLARHGREFGSVHVDAVLGLIATGRTGKSLDLPGGVRVHREYGTLILSSGGRAMSSQRRNLRTSPAAEEFDYEVRVPGTVRVAENGRRFSFDFVGKREIRFDSVRRAHLDYDRIDLPLVVRSIRPGDRMQPLGMKGRKKIKSILIDEKIERNERRGLPVVADRNSVLWIPGVRLSERVKIREETETVLRIEIH